MSSAAMSSANLDSFEVWRHYNRSLSESSRRKEELEQLRGKRQVVSRLWRGYSHPRPAIRSIS